MVEFDDTFRRQLRELFVWRRDVRRFRNQALPDGAMERLIETACLSPSVGLSQPWRFVIVDDPARRRAVIDDFQACNANVLNRSSGERADDRRRSADDRTPELRARTTDTGPGALKADGEPGRQRTRGMNAATARMNRRRAERMTLISARPCPRASTTRPQ